MNRFWFLHPGYLWQITSAFVNDWCSSRRWFSLLYGLPALLVCLLLIVIWHFHHALGPLTLVDRYSKQMVKATETADYDKAHLCLQKLIALEPDRDAHRFQLALLAEQQEDPKLARQLMSRIASLDDSEGYPEAHRWIAVEILKEESVTPIQLQLAREHLVRVVAAQPDDMHANLLLAQLYLRERDYSRAALHFERVAEHDAGARLPLAQVCVVLDRKDDSRKHALLAVDHFAALAQQNPYDIKSQLMWAEAHLFLEHFSKAVDLLKEALRRIDDPRLRSMLAKVYVTWSDKTPSQQIARKLELLQQALVLGSNETATLERLAPFASKKNPQWKETREQLNAALTAGKGSAIVHFILGAAAMEDGDTNKALVHYEQAFRLNPRMPAICNNLAWTLANQDEPDLDRALELATLAVQLSPGSAEVRETRGSIYLQLQSWRQAIVDLEFALRAFPEHVGIHESLADAYEQLGDKELAAKHREVVKKLDR